MGIHTHSRGHPQIFTWMLPEHVNAQIMSITGVMLLQPSDPEPPEHRHEVNSLLLLNVDLSSTTSFKQT